MMHTGGMACLTSRTRCRDFPPDQIPPLSAICAASAPADGQRTDMASYLNPWLARHAVLVCSTVKVGLAVVPLRPTCCPCKCTPAASCLGVSRSTDMPCVHRSHLVPTSLAPVGVQEMNELRFVLVPKRLTDEQFWSIYFALTRARLPKEAFDTAMQASPEPAKPAAAAAPVNSFLPVTLQVMQCCLNRSSTCRAHLWPVAHW